WYEIVFNSNYGAARANSGTGMMRRRYLEGELFGQYDNEDGTPGFRPSEAEALRIFRMLNKHENEIFGEIALFPKALGYAEAEWNAMTTAYRAAYGEEFSPTSVQPLDQELAPAFAKLLETFVQPSALLSLTGAPAEWNSLINFSPNAIRVAADTQGSNPFHAPEVAANTVDRTGGGASRDLIFGAITSSGGLDALAADTLRGGDGADWVVSGGGPDLIDGGAGLDVVDYANSPSAVDINLSDSLAEAGGFAQGDRLANVEAIIGSPFDDR